MPDFFMPLTDTPEQAEQAYAWFVAASKTYPLSHPTARLCAVQFKDRGHALTATVGQPLTGLGERVGAVLAIIDTTQLVCVFTEARSGAPIMVGQHEAYGKLYFDDYPAR